MSPGRDHKAEAQDGLATCPRTRSWEMAALGLHFRAANSKISSTVYFRNTKIPPTKVFFSQARPAPFIRQSERGRGRKTEGERKKGEREREKNRERDGERHSPPPPRRLWELLAHWADGAWPSGNILFIRATPTPLSHARRRGRVVWWAKTATIKPFLPKSMKKKEKTPNLLQCFNLAPEKYKSSSKFCFCKDF